MSRKFTLTLLGLLLSALFTYAQKTIKGKVTDANDGQPIPGVSVSVKGQTGNTVVTNNDGSFTINVPSNNSVLVFTYVGYATKEAQVGSQALLNVALNESTQTLESVTITTALGITRDRKALAYSAQTVTADELNVNKQTNVLNALQGKVAGAQISSTGGAPGQGSSIRIRGINSIDPNRSNEPLFVIDGILIDNSTSTFGSGAELRNMSNRATDVNPEDIETINVLKGGAATALYGLRGSNGVVVITTKKGKSGKFDVNFSSTYGVENINKKPDIQRTYTAGILGSYVPIGLGPAWGPTIEEAKLTAQQEAKKIIINTIQRVGTEEAVENCVSVFNIESDDVKGRIIGREGRNIRALEAATGVEIIVDDTPEAIILSCFDPVRREIARLSLHKLVTDGRIHPARIEEVVAKTAKQIDDEIIEVGKRTVIDLGIHGLHPELIKVVGRMKYRSSYGQNLLQHSREVSKLCGIMAAELGLNVKLAKRAGLLHDIGKVPDTESDLPHALLGMQWAEKYGEKEEVCNAIGAHHDEIEMKSLLSPIIQVCDAISGARPGARRQVLDSYIQRLKDLEEVAYGFGGVKSAYAIQAGRELRVIVESEKVSDDKASNLSFEISQKIQTEMTYPGQVKVTVIRETRAVNIAK